VRQRDFKKLQKSFLKNSEKIVDKTATKEHFHKTPQGAAKSEKLFFWFIDK